MSKDLHILSRADLEQVALRPQAVVKAVREALASIGTPGSECPKKLKVDVPSSVSYSMLGRSGSEDVVGFKTSFTHWGPTGDDGHRSKFYATTLSLYDDSTGAPIALMDGAPVGAVRTPAVSALLAEASGSAPRSVMVIGSGVQGQYAPVYLLATFPSIERIVLCGRHPEGLETARQATLDEARKHNREVIIEITKDPRTFARECQLIVGAAGPDTTCIVRAEDLSEGTTAVVVGYGIDASVCHQAERVFTTSTAQMHVTGTDYAYPDGTMPDVTAELPDLLRSGTTFPAHSGITLCYNSGLVLTDVAVGLVVARTAIDQGLGTKVSLW